MKTIIIGGVAGGMSAATRLRRLDENREIIILEKGAYVSFANCGLPYYVGNEIVNREDLIVQTPKQLQDRFNLDVRVNSEVVSIDPNYKTVQIKQGEQTYEEIFDDLIISVGAKPFVPPILGIQEASNVYTVRNIPDIDAIMNALASNNIKHVSVLGAGFIGLEMAENLRKRHVEVTIVDVLPHVLANADIEMATFLHEELKKNSIQLLLGKKVVELKQHGAQIVFDDGSLLNTDMIIAAAGIQADTHFLKESGIALNERGSILIDEQYQTNFKDIYAVGDATITKHSITKEPVAIALASPANRQGRQVADVIVRQRKQANKGNLGTAIVRVFNQTFAYTGLNEKQLKNANLPYACVHIQAKDHAGYYPNSTLIELKLLFNKIDGILYGAQAVGEKGVDKRIDILATAIKANLTVFDLQELEFTYAPPFGSAKDPVNMVGYAASNIVEKLSDSIQWSTLHEQLDKDIQLIDVREPNEYAHGTIKTAITIPLHELRDKLSTLDKTKETVIYCHSGLRSYLAERILKQNGFQVKNLDGAYHLYAMMHPEDIVR